MRNVSANSPRRMKSAVAKMAMRRSHNDADAASRRGGEDGIGIAIIVATAMS
jgi:hypothetical protein